MDLGNAGESSSLVWLYCDLQNWGRTSIKQGHRPELPLDRPNLWVFCPLLKANFPRDRELVENCEKCSHYKGCSSRLNNAENKLQQKDSSFKCNIIPAKKIKPKIVITEEQWNVIIKEKKCKDKEWKKNEIRLQK